jgi:hypothetical protein
MKNNFPKEEENIRSMVEYLKNGIENKLLNVFKSLNKEKMYPLILCERNDYHTNPKGKINYKVVTRDLMEKDENLKNLVPILDKANIQAPTIFNEKLVYLLITNDEKPSIKVISMFY